MKKSALFLIIFVAIFMVTNAQPPVDHFVKKGQSVWEVSQMHHNSGVFWEKISTDNNLTIKTGPNPNWYYPEIKPGDVLKIYPLHPQPTSVPDLKPAESEFVTPDPIPNSWWEDRTGAELFLGLAALCLLILLIVIINKYTNTLLQEKKYKENWLTSASKVLFLEEKNEKLRNKLPIEAPEIVNSDWLRENSPMGNPIPNNPDARVIEKAFGRYPHLVVQAKVSTHPKSIEMGFSHDRKAITALDGVVAYLGWNWNKTTKKWDEVGYVAGPCANGFVFTPEAIKKGMTFSKIELVSSENPVIMTDIKADTNRYPEMVWPLIQEYHRLNIAQIKMAGMAVFAHKPKKAQVEEKPAEPKSENLN